MKILRLTLKQEYFRQILTGRKKEEYREIKKYFIKKFEGNNEYTHIKFINGYNKTSPTMIVEFLGVEIKEINVDLFSGKQNVYAIKLGKIIETKNV